MSVRRLLIIDDEPAVGEFVRRVAEEMDYEVSLVTRGEQFKQSYLSFQPTVVFVDMILPDTDGTELVGWLADHHCTARVIVTTGHDRTYAEYTVKIGMAKGLPSVMILTKPIHIHDLRSAFG